MERTPEDFTFNVKAFRLFTGHQTQPKALPKDLRDELPPTLATKRTLYYGDLPQTLREKLWGMFESALLPLHDAGKLGAVVFQFPPWFMPRKSNFKHIVECKETLARFKLAVEFRNEYWLNEDGLGVCPTILEETTEPGR